MPDFTKITVERQLNYLTSEIYEIGIYERSKDKMIIRRFNAKEIINSLKFLKYQNFNGSDIFIRPWGETPFVFVDDLSRSDLINMSDCGFKLSVVLESSPLNYHGWLRLNEPIKDTKIATIVGQYIARRFGADKRSSDWRHFGRLAGFTNRKPAYVNDFGNYPFVNIHELSGFIYKDVEYLKNEAILDFEKIENSKNNILINSVNLDLRTEKPPECFYKDFVNDLKLYWINKTGSYNSSDGDWQVVICMFQHGFSHDQISSTLFMHSDSVKKRSKSRANDYVNRTINNAYIRFLKLKDK